ncbi:MAG TPA: EAL domain-containing protein [Tianweitania sediminis]|jgi:predicted signal transduction protein with EAL and GGDEF domain|nr:EAL domain-containing protein [Tianweitania sediminis]
MIEIDEDARLDALYQLNLLDTSPNEAFDRVTRMAAQLLSPKDPKTVALVRSMLTLSRDMGYRVVAEGVEQQEAADLLLAMGCEEAQGYLFSRPLEAWDFEELLRRSTGTKPLLTAVA